MESWHSQKLNKYTSLAKVIEDNGWDGDLFLLKLVLRDNLLDCYQFALKDWVLIIKLLKKTITS